VPAPLGTLALSLLTLLRRDQHQGRLRVPETPCPFLARDHQPPDRLWSETGQYWRDSLARESQLWHGCCVRKRVWLLFGGLLLGSTYLLASGARYVEESSKVQRAGANAPTPSIPNLEAGASQAPPLSAREATVESAKTTVHFSTLKTLFDPLNGDRSLQLGPALPRGWEKARPSRDLQYSLGVLERGGSLPCEAPDPGFGVHNAWEHVRPMGQFIAPRGDFLGPQGELSLVVHFHGHRPARKELVRTGDDLVLLGISKGPGSAYGPDFSDPRLLESLIEQTLTKISRRVGRQAHLQHLALSSWSRGYEAIEQILTQPLGKQVSAIILLDSLHASHGHSEAKRQLRPFLEFARRAARGEVFFALTHSAIIPPHYASSTETVHRIISSLGGVPRRVARRDPLGLELVELYSQGALHTRGYSGNGKLDHCAHFGAYAGALRGLVRYWNTRG